MSQRGFQVVPCDVERLEDYIVGNAYQAPKRETLLQNNTKPEKFR